MLINHGTNQERLALDSGMASNVAQALSVLVGALSSLAVVVTQACTQAHLTATPSTSSDSNSTSRYGFVFVFTIARVEPRVW